MTLLSDAELAYFVNDFLYYHGPAKPEELATVAREIRTHAIYAAIFSGLKRGRIVITGLQPDGQLIFSKLEEAKPWA